MTQEKPDPNLPPAASTPGTAAQLGAPSLRYRSTNAQVNRGAARGLQGEVRSDGCAAEDGGRGQERDAGISEENRDGADASSETDAFLIPQMWSKLPRSEAERRVQGAARLAQAFSSSPYYRARAERDPDYWNKFYDSRVNW
jgi:hypothetical protein